ncbi:hypothetical protein LUZ60_016700 [Juncus effusus]|nr:hypothetical protein LUZ60_016700 [Juncus effusus]
MDRTRMGPDWSLLPPEMIQLISEKITFMKVYCRFRAVCPEWRRASSPNPRHLSLGPWLHLPDDQRIPSNNPNNSTYSYYDFFLSKIHQFHLPCDTYGSVICSSRSWLVLKRGSQLSLINVITGEIKSDLFPSLDAPPTILGFASTGKTKRLATPEGTLGPKYLIQKAVLTSTPSDESCAIVVSFCTSNTQWELAFCKVGDRCWTVLRLPERGRGSRTMKDFMYQNGLVYAINDKCHISVYDLRDLSQKIMHANLSYYSACDRVYLVSGEVEHDGPLIVRHADPFRKEDQLQVFKCYEYLGYYRYKRVRDIGNNVLFLDGRRCLIISCRQGWTRNHIYYYYKSVNSEFYNITLKMLNIKDSSVGLVGYDSTGLLSTRSMYPSWFTADLY